MQTIQGFQGFRDKGPMQRVDPYSWVWKVYPGIYPEDTGAVLKVNRWRTRNEVKRDIRMKVIRLEQNTDAWAIWREGGIGASETAAILGINPWQSREEVWAVKTKRKLPFAGNEHTRRGKALEPAARALYEDIYGWTMEAVCGVHDIYPWLRASFDGVREDGKLILEVKCPTVKWHYHTIEKGVPDWYMVQVQHQLLVADAPLCHFLSYCPDYPKRKLVVCPVKAAHELQQHILEELEAFWAEVTVACPSSGCFQADR